MSKHLTTNDLDMVDDVYGAMMTDAPSGHRLIIWALAAMVACTPTLFCCVSYICHGKQSDLLTHPQTNSFQVGMIQRYVACACMPLNWFLHFRLQSEERE